MPKFKPEHIPCTAQDLEGNGGHGRILILPGSDGRARSIAERLKGVQSKQHPRCHNFYWGQLAANDKLKVDVGVISTGMGTPSIDIVATELLKLGGRTFFRVGTCGSLQTELCPAGSVVVPTAAVRDESTSLRYLPVEIPALPSFDFLCLVKSLSEVHSDKYPAVNFGPIHTKDSLFAREFGEGPRAKENKDYMGLLQSAGVLASEMECSQLFTLCALWNQRSKKPIVAGAFLAVIGDKEPFAGQTKQKAATDGAIQLALDTAILFRKKWGNAK